MMSKGHRLAGLSSSQWAETIRVRISDPTIQVVVANAVWWDCFGNSVAGSNPEMKFFVEVWRDWQLNGQARKKAAAVKQSDLTKAFQSVGYGPADAKLRAKSFCARNYDHEREFDKPQVKPEWGDE